MVFGPYAFPGYSSALKGNSSAREFTRNTGVLGANALQKYIQNNANNTSALSQLRVTGEFAGVLNKEGIQTYRADKGGTRWAGNNYSYGLGPMPTGGQSVGTGGDGSNNSGLGQDTEAAMRKKRGRSSTLMSDGLGQPNNRQSASQMLLG